MVSRHHQVSQCCVEMGGADCCTGSSLGEECVVHFPSLNLTSELPQEDLLPLGQSCTSTHTTMELKAVLRVV